MRYCVRGAKPADSVGYSEGQAEKRLGSLASWSEPRQAWSVKPCQMEPFSKQWELRRCGWKTGGWMLWGRRGWAFIYSRWHVGFMIRNDTFVGHQGTHPRSKVPGFCIFISTGQGLSRRMSLRHYLFIPCQLCIMYQHATHVRLLAKRKRSLSLLHLPHTHLLFCLSASRQQQAEVSRGLHCLRVTKPG